MTSIDAQKVLIKIGQTKALGFRMTAVRDNRAKAGCDGRPHWPLTNEHYRL